MVTEEQRPTLDALLEPYRVRIDPTKQNDPHRDAHDAIKAAYRMGHDDGRMARIRQDEETFIERLRREHGDKS